MEERRFQRRVKAANYEGFKALCAVDSITPLRKFWCCLKYAKAQIPSQLTAQMDYLILSAARLPNFVSPLENPQIKYSIAFTSLAKSPQ